MNKWASEIEPQEHEKARIRTLEELGIRLLVLSEKDIEDIRAKGGVIFW